MWKLSHAWRVLSPLFALALLLASPLSVQAKPAYMVGNLLPPAQAVQPGPDLAQAVIQSVTADSSLSRSDGYIWTIMSMSLSEEKTQAVVLLALVDPATGAMLPTEPLTVIASLIPAAAPGGAAQWQVTLPGQADFNARLESFPLELQDPSLQSELATSSTSSQPEAASGAPFGGYYLPWANGVTQAMVQGAHHVTCLVPSDCYYAFDFAAKYTDPPKFPILAAKGGSVYTFYDGCDDRPESATVAGTCTNYIVLQDKSTNPTTYQIYLHLSKNTIPSNFQKIGAAVRQGDWIANADNTGPSWGSHVHFMVVTTIYNVGYKPPSYPWGASVDITFKDVKINWDAATQGGRPCGQSDVGYGKCVQWQYYYVSGNQVVNAPTGGLTAPDSFQTLTDPTLAVSGWGADLLGVTRLSLVANYNGTWQEVGPAQTASPFDFNLDLCAAGIPDGPFDLALRVWNLAGNQSPPLDPRHLMKEIPSCPNLPPQAPPPTNCSDPASTQVVLYSEPNYGGACLTLNNGFQGYITSLISSVSSIQVGSSVKGILYQWGSPGSRRETFASSDRNLADNFINNNSADYVTVDNSFGGLEDPIPLAVLGPSGAAPTAVDSLILAWDHGAGATVYHALLFTGKSSDNSVCTNGAAPYLTLDWQYGLTWPVGALPAGDYTVCVQGRFTSSSGSNYLSNWNFSSFTVGPGTLPASTPVSLPYSDTMENGVNSWTATGLWRQASDPLNPANHAWVFNNITDYSAAYPAKGDLTSPPILLPASGTQYLRFAYDYQTEAPTPYWDQRWVQVSKDGGPFQNLLQLSEDAMGAWLQSPFIPLADYAGSTIRLRFHFDAIDPINNSFPGWYVDNVTVNNTPPPTCNQNTTNHMPGSAMSIAYGADLSATICPPGNVDYYQFQGTQGDVLLAEIDAQSLTPPSPLDSLLTLFLGPDTRSVIAENDNKTPDGSNKDSYLRYTLPATGMYYLRVKAQNGPGVGGPDYRYVLKVNKENDVTAPTVTLTNPAPGKGVNGQTVMLTAAATDNPGGSGLSHVDFYWHPADWTNPAWTLIGSDANGTDGWQVPFDISDMAEGTSFSVYASAIDNAGNPSYSVNWNVVVDRTPPTVSLQPLPAQFQDTTFSLAWTGSDALTGIDHFTLQFSQDNGEWQDWPSPLPAAANHAWFVGAFGHAYAFRLSATDRAGNTGPLIQTSTTVAATCQKDSYEGSAGDSTLADAVPISLDVSQLHNFCGTGDNDWVTFTAQGGRTYLIFALPQAGSAAAPVLSLYTGKGQVVNGAQPVEPSELGQATFITWTAPASGTYALNVHSLDPAVAGTDVAYQLGVAEEHCIMLPLIISGGPK